MNARNARRYWVLALMLLVVTAVMATTIYKWIDASGFTHYSQTPPPGEKTRRLEIDTNPPPPQTEAERSAVEYWRERNAELTRRWMEQKKAEEAEKAEAARTSSDRRAECEYARAELDRLRATKPAIKGRPTISLRDPKTGEDVELMNNAERTIRIHLAEDEVRRWCDAEP